MTLADDLNSDLSSVFFDMQEFGTRMTYTPIGGGAQKRVTVILDFGIQRTGFETDIIDRHDEVTFIDDDVPAPKRGDTFSDGTNTYALAVPVADDGSISAWVVEKQ